MVKIGVITKEVFDSLGLQKSLSSDFYDPINIEKRNDSSAILPDGKLGYYAYSDAEEGLLIYCSSLKDENGIRATVSCLARNTKWGSSKYNYWQAVDGFGYIVKEDSKTYNSKYLSAKVRTFVKKFSKLMNSKEELRNAFRNL